MAMDISVDLSVVCVRCFPGLVGGILNKVFSWKLEMKHHLLIMKATFYSLKCNPPPSLYFVELNLCYSTKKSKYVHSLTPCS